MAKRKCTRGILGFPKPATPIFFSLNGELWPEDDSEDEDFTVKEKMSYSSFTIESIPSSPTKLKLKREFVTPPPPGSENHNGKKQKKHKKSQGIKDEGTQPYEKKKKRVSSKKKKNSEETIQGDSAEMGPMHEGAWGRLVPKEILVKIFHHVVEDEGIYPLIHIFPWVCDLWNQASQHPVLWQRVELSPTRLPGYTPLLLAKVCSSPAVANHARDIALKDWEKIKIEPVIEAIAQNCTNLLSLSIHRCNLTSSSLKLIADKCQHLSRLDFSALSNFNSASNAISESSLTYLVSTCKDRLTYLSLAQNKVTNRFHQILGLIGANLPNLQVLDLSNLNFAATSFILPVELLQQGCPHLRVLLLAKSSFHLSRACPHLSPGFQELEELSLVTSPESVNSLDDVDLERLVRDAKKLKLLDLRGCHKISVSGVVKVPAWDLNHIYLSQCGATARTDMELIFTKWAHSLKDVDLSFACNDEAVNQSVSVLATSSQGAGVDSSTSPSPLTTINLSSSAVSYESVKLLLKHCPNLSYLNLQSCRGLPRGMKRIYSHRGQLDKLRQEVQEGKYQPAL